MRAHRKRSWTGNTTVPADPAAVVVRWSPAEMLSRFGGDEARVGALVAAFLANYRQHLSDIQSAVVRGEPEAVQAAARRLARIVAAVTTSAPATTAVEIEALAAGGRLRRVPPVLARFELEVEQLAWSLRAFERHRACEC